MEKQEILNLLKDKKELCKKRIDLPQHVDFKIVGKTCSNTFARIWIVSKYAIQ